jgi:hypothetical protein
MLRGRVSAVALLAATAVRAENGPAVPPEPLPASLAPDPVLRFRAERLELDPSLSRLRLSGGVSVGFDRYRLTSQRLELSQRAGTIEVEGRAELAFCACPDPPLTLGFSSATLSRSDVVLAQPTVRAFGVPVFWLPWLWVRPRSEWGVLPLKVAYRGEDGLLLGSGVHAPVGTASVDVSAAAYFRGGVELEGRLVTERSATTVRWDYLHESALALDLRGSASPGETASIAWSADALRGARALRGPALLEEVALRQDRARAAAGWSEDGVTAGIGVGTAAPRGAATSSGALGGPDLSVGFGGALGRGATANLDAGVATWALPDANTLTLISERGELRGDARAGPVAFDGAARTRALATLDEGRQGYTATAAATGEVSVPFMKEFGAPEAPLSHWVVPFATGQAGMSDTRAPSVVPAIAGTGGFFVAAAGIRSSLGETAARRGAVSVSAQAGYAGDGGGTHRPMLAWRATGRAAAVAVRGEGISTRGSDASDTVLSTLRVGPEGGWFVEGRAFGTRNAAPLIGRMFAAGLDAPWAPWLGAPGWSVGGRVGVPWTRVVSTTADLDYDATSAVLLGVRGAISYRHPCGCLAAAAWAGHRAARPGADAFLTLSLVR